MVARRVFLHVGAPKSGTTYLQGRLAANARSLAHHGLLVPTTSRLVPRPQAHFTAALDLLGQDWGGPPGHAAGAWPRLVDAVRRAPADAVVSHEILAPAPPAAVRRALDELGAGGHEVHVVLTARELAGALASAWQESLKQGRRWTLQRFLDLAESRRGWWFRALDLPTVLESWGAQLPPERLHLVTVPARSGGQDVLWERYCSALGGADPVWGPREPAAANRSLGTVEAELLLRLNLATGRERADDRRAERIAALLGPGGLEDRRSPRLRLPDDARAWAAAESQRWRTWLDATPLTLHGSLDDLVVAPAPGATELEEVAEAAVLARALQVRDALESAPAPVARDRLRRGVRRGWEVARGTG